MSYLTQSIVYLLQALFGLYILAVLLRFLFQLVRADFYNPISQFLVKVTNPPLRPLRRVIPGLWEIDLASVVLLLALQYLKIYLVLLIIGYHPKFGGLVILAAAELVELTVYIFIVTLFVRVLISWFNPYGGRHPAMNLLYSLTEPMMRPARRLLPPISGMDLSPIIVFLLLGLSLRLIVQPLLDLGQALAR